MMFEDVNVTTNLYNQTIKTTTFVRFFGVLFLSFLFNFCPFIAHHIHKDYSLRLMINIFCAEVYGNIYCIDNEFKGSTCVDIR